MNSVYVARLTIKHNVVTWPCLETSFYNSSSSTSQMEDAAKKAEEKAEIAATVAATREAEAKQADVLSVSSADADSIAKSQLALSEAGPARHCVARHVIDTILNHGFLSSLASHHVASNICQAYCPPCHRHAFEPSFLELISIL